MNMMKYKGYIARIEYDEEDRIFVGHLAGIKDIVGFHGTTVDDLESAFHESVDSYIAISEETGRSPQKPYSSFLGITSRELMVTGLQVSRGVEMTKWVRSVEIQKNFDWNWIKINRFRLNLPE